MYYPINIFNNPARLNKIKEAVKQLKIGEIYELKKRNYFYCPYNLKQPPFAIEKKDQLILVETKVDVNEAYHINCRFLHKGKLVQPTIISMLDIENMFALVS